MDQYAKPEEAQQLLQMGKLVGLDEKRGKLDNGAHYIIRRTRKGIEAVADFYGVERV